MARRKTKTRTIAARKAAAKKAPKRPVATKPRKRAAVRAARKPKPARTVDPTAAMRALAQHIVDVSLGDDDEAILALYADDVESSEAGGLPAIGKDALRAKFAGWRSMTTETAFEPRRIMVDGNVIVIEWLGRATLAASGRRAELHEVAVHEIRDGKIAREAFFYDPTALA
ncbi:MAG: nuclear transport factor 2 family protein [Deltaproteobacteria bacterium]|nr:nuclear transport factor 2 family protein [Deltaproteobacteria bacterium]